MEVKQFHNFTDKDFTWKYDGIAYTFGAGQTIFLEDYKADHFAEHLVDEEMNRQGLPTNDPKRASLIAQCFPTATEPVTVVEALDINEKAKVKKGKKKEAEFEDLKE